MHKSATTGLYLIMSMICLILSFMIDEVNSLEKKLQVVNGYLHIVASEVSENNIYEPRIIGTIKESN